MKNVDDSGWEAGNKVVAGSNRALAELYRQHSGRLRLFMLGILRDRADADDALQRVFLKLLEAWESVRSETAKGWLYTVAYHEALAIRQRRELDEKARAKLWSRSVWQGQRNLESYDVLRDEDAQRVCHALQRLPPAQREVIERRIYRDQTFAAIASELRCPLGTVLTRMRLALAKLRNLLEE